MHYEGKLTDGTVFDSSVARGSPIDLPVGGVIPGWVEGLQLMHVGEKYKLYIPSELAYGEQSPSPAIPANSVLVFDLELIGIKDQAARADRTVTLGTRCTTPRLDGALSLLGGRSAATRCPECYAYAHHAKGS